jgi:hypothetical protein
VNELWSDMLRENKWKSVDAEADSFYTGDIDSSETVIARFAETSNRQNVEQGRRVPILRAMIYMESASLHSA